MEHHDIGLEHEAETVSMFYCVGLNLGGSIMFVFDVSDVFGGVLRLGY